MHTFTLTHPDGSTTTVEQSLSWFRNPSGQFAEYVQAGRKFTISPELPASLRKAWGIK